MSAYLVSDDCIVYLCFALADYELTRTGGTFYYEHAGQSAQLKTDNVKDLEDAALMLFNACRDSVGARYSHDPDMIGEPRERFTLPARCPWKRFDPVQVIKSVRHYQYQSCEIDTWRASRAKSLTDALLVYAASKVPGYEEAAWGCPPRDKFHACA